MLKDIHWIGRTIILIAIIAAFTAIAIVSLGAVSPALQPGTVERKCSIPPGYLDPLTSTQRSDDPNARFTLYCDK